MPTRVLYVSAASAIGGAERSLLELIRTLDRNRYEPVVAIPGPGDLERLVRAAGAEVFHIPPVWFRRTWQPLRLLATGMRWASAVAALTSEAKRRGVDMVHSNSTVAHLVGGPAASMLRVPCIWHVRDLHRLPVLRHGLAVLSDRVALVSYAALETLGLPGRARATARVIPNGIDADEFARAARPGHLRAELKVAPDTPLLLMAAHMVPWKGHETLIRATAVLRKARPDIVVAIAGEDLLGHHRAYAQSVRQLVRILGLADSIHFLGYRDNVASLMTDCDVLVVPSEGEPFGRVALEAMALGRPVVGTEGGGLSEVVRDGVTGLIVPQRDPDALAAALERLLADPSLRERMGEAGRGRVRERFAIAGHAWQICLMYEQAMKSRHLSLAS